MRGVYSLLNIVAQNTPLTCAAAAAAAHVVLLPLQA
jgi:hypothetical protein